MRQGLDRPGWGASGVPPWAQLAKLGIAADFQTPYANSVDEAQLEALIG